VSAISGTAAESVRLSAGAGSAPVAAGQGSALGAVRDYAEQDRGRDDRHGRAGPPSHRDPPAPAARNTTEGQAPGDRTSPRNAVVAQPSLAPIRATATGAIRTTVRLSTAIHHELPGQVFQNMGRDGDRAETRAIPAATPGPRSPRRRARAAGRARPAMLANARPPVNAAMKPLPCKAIAEAYAHNGPGRAPPRPQKPSASHFAAAGQPDQPAAPRPPTTRADDQAEGQFRDGPARAGHRFMRGKSRLPPTATSTNGVAIPSFSPLSRLIRRRISGGKPRG